MDEELKDINLDWESEKLCRWAAARAGVIVVAPVVGSMALIANEVYMITRMAELRGVKLDEGAVLGLLGGLGATFVGQTLATLIPFPPLQIPAAVSITYGVGRAADAWIKAGHPEDVAQFKEIFVDGRKEGMDNLDDLKDNDGKDTPLGDEKKVFDLKKIKDNLKDVKAETVYAQVRDHADKAETVLSSTLRDLNERLFNPLRKKTEHWVSAQKWEQLSHGELVIPYVELKNYFITAMAGSDFALLDIGYVPEDKLFLTMQHKSYGSLRLELTIRDFYVDAKEAFTHLHVESFDVTDNKFAELVIKMVGDKLILAILNLAFDRAQIENGGVVTSYAEQVVSIDFAKLLQDSKLAQKKLMEKSVLDVVRLLDLKPLATGIKVKASITL